MEYSIIIRAVPLIYNTRNGKKYLTLHDINRSFSQCFHVVSNTTTIHIYAFLSGDSLSNQYLKSTYLLWLKKQRRLLAVLFCPQADY